MSPVLIGLLVLVATLLVLATGLPIAFGLGAVALLFMVVFDGWGSVHYMVDTIFAGLDDFTTHTEATHWSGAIHGSDTALIEQLQVPIVDIEIGSAPETLADLRAAAVLADALLAVFDDDRRPKTLLCLGGIHFDSTYSAALIQPALPLSIGHFLPTIWLVNGDYSGERGLALLQHALDTVIGGVDAIVFNDNMKKPVKDCVRAFAEQSSLPLLKHRRLHAPLEIDWTG